LSNKREFQQVIFIDQSASAIFKIYTPRVYLSGGKGKYKILLKLLPI